MTYKDPSAAYIVKEEASERKPVELYHIWREDESEHWYHTDGDVSITFGEQEYTPATLSRSPVEYDDSLEASKMNFFMAQVSDPIPEYISLNPVDPLWISVTKLFRDQDPYEGLVIFIGQIKSVAIKGASATAECVGFEFFLKQKIPFYRCQAACNWTLFDSKCTLTEASYKVTTNVTVSSNGLTLTSSDFEDSNYSDGYFVFGKLVFEKHERMITYHVGNTIKLRFPISTLVSTDEVDVYPGCKGDVETCRDKFDNVINFGGHPYVPLDNPATWD